MDASNVRELFRPFDPVNPNAEEQYDEVVRRLNRVRARRARYRRELARLETQFIDNDLTVASGPRRGAPLSRAGRRRRLARLIEVGAELRRLHDEERFSASILERMNAALERWARETYGP
jgi:hypothetical protein